MTFCNILIMMRTICNINSIQRSNYSKGDTMAKMIKEAKTFFESFEESLERLSRALF